MAAATAISNTELTPPAETVSARDSGRPITQKRRFYLPEVDGVRCLAVLLVWVHHYPSGPRTVLRQFNANGWIGVNVFLVLSSFLITSLLMLEAETKGSISLPRFYSRRFLRIWPLLGLALALNYLLLPAINYFPWGFRNAVFIHDLKYHAIPNALLLGNWSAAIFGYLQYGFCNHLWTINLEEQFYLLWPILMFYLVRNPRRIFLCCMGLIAVSYIARYYYVSVGFKHPALWVSTITRLDPLAFGGILAIVYPRLRKWLARNRHLLYSLLAIALFVISVGLIALTLRGWPPWDYGSIWWKAGLIDTFVALCVCCIINNPVLAFLFRLPVVAWLGKISYGLYVYQKFFVDGVFSVYIRSLCLQITGGHANLTSWGLGMLINSLALVAVSAASYYCFERWFLKFKERFESVLSRPA
jgi:peptidoglycan/LPS O-acetylase OafA/YrhL